MDSAAGLILYEFPCNEKIRMYLRIEALFERFDWFVAQDSQFAHHAALSALFDLIDASARSDLRNELLHELERQRQGLITLRGNKEVNQEALEETLMEIAQVSKRIAQVVGRSGQRLRENEWLQLVRTRQSIPGGTCVFDMPLLHRWLCGDPNERRKEFHGWSAPMLPMKEAVMLVLRHIRASTTENCCTAQTGTYQLPMSSKAYTLARIWLARNDLRVPEVSANKYMLWIRFSKPDQNRRLHAAHEPVSFRLGLCG